MTHDEIYEGRVARDERNYNLDTSNYSKTANPIMTHDELRDYIDKFDAAGMVNELVVKALRAVVELHKPWDGARMGGGGFTGPWCTHCEEVYDGSIRYPCPTIEAIEKDLK